jgi:hypothetical protein
VRTGIRMRAGSTYRLTASGEWTDLAKSCGPDGYVSREYPNKFAGFLLRLVEWTRRVRHANWFALIGAVDSDRRNKFVIGREARITARSDGELLCFANDFWLAYGNNSGSVDLVVEES